MDRLTEEQLRNEVMYLHSLYRQGPLIPNPNPYPISNPNFIPNSPIFNPNPPNSIYPSTNPYPPISNPNHILNSPIFNPNPPNSIYPISNPSLPITNPNFIPNFNPNPNSIIPTIPNSNPHGYMYTHNPNVLPVTNPYRYVPRDSETVNHSNLNHKFSRLSVAIELTKPKKKKKKRGKKGVGNDGEGKKWPRIPEKEWPCNPSPEHTYEWPTLKLKPVPVDRVLTLEENARFVATKSQQKALDAAKEMFRESMDSDGEVEDHVSDDDDDDDDDDYDECEEYKFFLKVFTEDSELKSYYEKNCESGEFSCLVCVGIGQKVGKKFKDCVALVQHSITIAKTKKRQAHRALGKVICKVLGWEIEKLPSINLPKICDSEGNGPHDRKENFNVDKSEVVQDKNDSASEVLPDNAVSLTTVGGAELMVCEHSLVASDGNKSVDKLENGTPSTAKGN